MASSEPVHPLRISKNTPTSSPVKMASSLPRPLSELSPTEKRRNSPSWNQNTKKMTLNTDSSPFQSSPLETTTSPRLFWQSKGAGGSENSLYSGGVGGGRSGSPSPVRRSSIEKLQKASRVKNSNILALEQKQEYDPTRVTQIERPLARQVQGNAYGSTGISGLRANKDGGEGRQQRKLPPRGLGHHRNESQTNIPLYSPTKSTTSVPATPTFAKPPMTPSKDQLSPMKSSLSTRNFKGSFDAESNAAWLGPGEDVSSDEHELPSGKSLHRHAKSVTFDAAPPQINEYEMATPDLSSVGSNSREGSYDSTEEYDPDHMGHGDADGQEDSFDASLEDTAKTPVVGPDDWRQDSPGRHDGFESSPMPGDGAGPVPPSRGGSGNSLPPPPAHGRTDSSSSLGEFRPLPPLPGLPDLAASTSGGLSATAERMLNGSLNRRSLPSPPPAPAAAASTKREVQNIGNSRMPLEERLKLMMLSDGGGDGGSNRASSPAAATAANNARSAADQQQRERRMRRAGGRERVGSQTPEAESGIPATVASAVAGPYDDEAGEEDDTIGDLSGLDDYQLPPRISRESILRRVNGTVGAASDYRFSSPALDSSPERRVPLDPDVPIPSTEDSYLDASESSVIVRPRAGEEQEDAYDIPDMYGDDGDNENKSPAEDDAESNYSDGSARKTSKDEEDATSTPRATSPADDHKAPFNFSATLPLPSAGADAEPELSKSLQPYMLPKPKELPLPEGPRMSDVQAYMQRPYTPDQQQQDEAKDHHGRRQPKRQLSKPEYDGSGWGDPDEYDESEAEQQPGTPDSVIHNPVADDDDDGEGVFGRDGGDIYDEEAMMHRDSPAVPETVATIKSSSGSKLKTRPSTTPSDLVAMREARRQFSRELMTAPGVPPIPEKHRNRLSRDMEAEMADGGDERLHHRDEYLERHPSFKKRSLTLDLDYGLSLDQDFDRVIEAQKVAFSAFTFSAQDEQVKMHAASHGQGAANRSDNEHPVAAASKMQQQQQQQQQETLLTQHTNISLRKPQRGYLMRQNTKLVAASDKDGADGLGPSDLRGGFRSAGNSPVKKDRPQSWTVEPWNGQVRKKSVRSNKRPAAGPVPPLPGQESNAAALNPLAEEDFNAEMATEESGERGRLFVKVMGVKDLDLPIPKNERTWFSLTLDNGVHCVTTAWLELARNAPIGQEFELVVPNDLEFQLTLNVKLDKPAPLAASSSRYGVGTLPTSPSKSSRAKTGSTFSRVFASPKKRKEMEAARQREEEELQRQERDAAQRARLAAAQQMSASAPSAWDLLSPLAADDGSFARAYVCLKEHEHRCFGRPYLVDVPAFNEWAVEDAAFASSVKSKRGGVAVGGSATASTSGSIVRRAPYKVGKLELQLLFVPRPKGAADEDMPKSMNSCIRELKAAEERLARNWEGPLSQQGGDCPYWRRRYFKLVGTKLTAYHEATRQPRATINLANARRLIDDRRSLMEKETTGRGGRRRKSAFAEEEEGYMFVEEGFRIRFNNGEVIDFYADAAEDKEGWMKVLADVVGRDSTGGSIAADDDGASSMGSAAGPRMKGRWCELILKREEALRRRAEGTTGRRVHSRTKSMYT